MIKKVFFLIQKNTYKKSCEAWEIKGIEVGKIYKK